MGDLDVDVVARCVEILSAVIREWYRGTCDRESGWRSMGRERVVWPSVKVVRSYVCHLLDAPI